MTAILEAPPTAAAFVGIDPSLTGTGLCIMPKAGSIDLRCIKTTKHSHGEYYRRVKHIATIVLETVDSIGEVRVCIESPFMNPRMLSSAQELIELNFMIRDRLYWGGIPFNVVAPSSLKKFAAGNGGAKKDVIIKEVWKRWNIDTNDNNEADAAVLAHIAQVIEAVRTNQDIDAWPRYQIEVARKVMESEKR